MEYNKFMAIIKTKYQDEIDELGAKIIKIDGMEKKSEHTKVALNTFILQKQARERAKYGYVERSIKTNSKREVSIVLIRDVFKDNKEMQAKLFKALTVVNKNSALYLLLKAEVEQK